MLFRVIQGEAPALNQTGEAGTLQGRDETAVGQTGQPAARHKHKRRGKILTYNSAVIHTGNIPEFTCHSS